MKTLAIIVAVLAIITMIYGFNPKRLKKLKDNMAKCSKDLGESSSQPLSSKAILCALTKDGQIVDKDGLFSVEKCYQALQDFISDPAKLEQGKKIFQECYDKNMQGKGTNQEKTAKITECALPIVALHGKA
ncbi:venom allergen 2-like [Odontomachus brunneus]|uniref:venom allergen 2-like n=1 Tax=Odontomachus brunneus TaxID=486640 RepID=UPI0013F21903|nr:venom allergen 2-like [Odontomachus brunneus]